MSRTNISVLIATALLGVLLVLVWQLADDLARPPPANAPPSADTTTDSFIESITVPLPDRAEPETAATPAGISRIANYDEFVSLLFSRGVNGVQELGITARWYQSRGFLGADSLLGITADDAPLVYYESLDDATLDGLRQAGDVGATQVLASRRALTDPFEAIDLYTEAAALGSVFAYLQLASLHDTLSAVPLSNLSENREMYLRLAEMRRSARVESFAYAMAALRDGGPPLADPDVVMWVNRLYDNVPEQLRADACATSEKIILEGGSRRRAAGQSPLNAEPPPVFLSVPDLPDLLPCADTGFGYYSMLDLSACKSETVQDGQGLARELFLCPN
ncbi:MAG: hypothetical protein QNJ73_01650 [Gammaproteobacteria bacterium]|nr:hypothetical protein [Gammaproteobacteria bacterium]